MSEPLMKYDYPAYCLCCGAPLSSEHGPGWCLDCYRFTHFAPFQCLKCDKHCEKPEHTQSPRRGVFSIGGPSPPL